MSKPAKLNAQAEKDPERAREHSKMQVKERDPEVQQKAGAPRSLVELFGDRRIRIRGTVEELLFNAADVARQIGDASHQARAVRGYDASYARRVEEKDPEGRERAVQYLTEQGVYRYLTQSRRKEAEAFQKYIYGVIEAERRRVVDAAELRARLAEGRAEAEAASHARTRAAWALERAELKKALELERFEKRWGPTEAERAYMGAAEPDEGSDWGPPSDYE